MDTETFLVVRRTIQDRLENRRIHLIQQKREESKSSLSPSILSIASWTLGQLRSSGTTNLWTGVLTAGAGWAFSHLMPQAKSKSSRWIERLTTLARIF